MRKSLIAVLLASSLPALALAMPPMEGHGSMHCAQGERDMNHAGKALNLSPEQRQALKNLKAEQFKAQHEITQRYLDKLPETERKAMAAERKAAQDKEQAGIKAQLNAEQLRAFEAQQSEREKRRVEWQEFQDWKAKKAQ